MSNRPSVDAGVRTLVVVCPDWPLVAGGVPLDRAAAVVHANRLVATTPAARRVGVRAGLRRRESQARCPTLTLLAHDPSRDARCFEPVAGALDAVTPRVEITRSGTCVFPTRGPSRYFGGDDALAALVATTVDGVLDGRGTCQVGVASGPFAADLAARHGPVTDGAAPVRVVAPGDTPGFLAPLPIGALGRPELTDVLLRLGVTTLGALADLEADDVMARFGLEGREAHRQAAGLDPRPPATAPPPPDLTVEIELDPPAERVDGAAFAAKRLADELHGLLASTGRACAQITVVAETEHGEVRERRWRNEGALTAAAMADRVRWQLDGWLHGGAAVRPTGGIVLLRLIPEEVQPATGRQGGFWGERTAATDRAVRALARVQGVLGEGAVTVPEVRGGRGPSEEVTGIAAECVDLGDRVVDPLPPAPWPGRLPRPAPTVVPRQPAPAEVTDLRGGPVGVSGRGLATAAPARVSIDGGRWAEVTGWAGPWPIDERWWDADAHRRRARFQVVTDAGEAHLLAVEAGRWWVEATYD